MMTVIIYTSIPYVIVFRQGHTSDCALGTLFGMVNIFRNFIMC